MKVYTSDEIKMLKRKLISKLAKNSMKLKNNADFIKNERRMIKKATFRNEIKY